MTLVNSVQGPTPWKKFRTTVGGSSTVNIDTIPLSTMTSVRYFVSFTNEGLNRYKSFEMTGTKVNADIYDSVFNKIAEGSIMIEASIKISGSNAVLEIVNNETFDLDVELIRGVLNG